MNKSSLDQEEWAKLLKEHGFTGTRPHIFINPTNHYSRRLTRIGFKFLTEKLQLTTFRFKLEGSISPKMLVQLERQIHNPYYIQNLKTIIVFDEVTAIMLQLHNSDLETYLNNLEQNS